MGAKEVLAHLTDGSVSVVVIGDGGMPEIGHWGTAIGEQPIDPALFERPVVGGGLDVDPPMGIVAEPSRGWFGRPGLEMHRSGGRDFAPQFVLASIEEATADRFAAELVDDHAQVGLAIELTLRAAGVLAVQATLRNNGADEVHVGALRVALPVPASATEIVQAGGRHNFEFVEHRSTWDRSAIVIENRHGKTSHERLGAAFAGTKGFSEQSGEVWGCHVGWSGNFELICDSITDGRKLMQAGEILLPGELTLGPGEVYETPPVFAAWSCGGLNGVSNAFHSYLRNRPAHPRLPRPVHLNTWEAVYFDHDADTLLRLADVAASVGIERFVLDDGWFGGRRNDRAGLGDWWISPDAWPGGLAPLIQHVRSLGMEFGIWLEPEMVNPDSQLFRENPHWALVDDRYPHLLGRNQLVLDVGRPEVSDYLFAHIDALLTEHDISYVKWDHNRDLVSPAAGSGRAGVHRQTRGVYDLLDRLRAAHPAVDFETCASGGGRADFGILDRTDRVWTSDSLDPLDRIRIQHGFSLLFPPELMGTHVGAPVSHATRRSHRLGFRAATAFFGSMGVEWNLLEASEADRDQLAELIRLHKRFRRMLHSGTVTRVDHPDTTVDVRGVVSSDRHEALIGVVRLASGPSHHTPSVRLPGLIDTVVYEVTVLAELGEPLGDAREQPKWVDGKLVATGLQLRSIGIPLPQLYAGSGQLIHLKSADHTTSPVGSDAIATLAS